MAVQHADLRGVGLAPLLDINRSLSGNENTITHIFGMSFPPSFFYSFSLFEQHLLCHLLSQRTKVKVQ